MRSIGFILCIILSLNTDIYCRELNVPQVPDSINNTQQKAAYLIEHYWDNVDFSDKSLSLDTLFIEQSFADYAKLFFQTDITYVLPKAAEKLMKLAEANHDTYNLLAETADTYLYESESPVCNETAYLYFLQAINNSRFIDRALRARYSTQLEDVMKNRPGSTATDFEIRLRNGNSTTLLNSCKTASVNLLIFYDPECSDCAKLVNTLKTDADLAEAISSGHLNIIAVYPEGDEDEFANATGKIPSQWIDGISPDGAVTEMELYSIPTFPTLYLIDNAGTVLLKNAGVINAMSEAKKLSSI